MMSTKIYTLLVIVACATGSVHTSQDEKQPPLKDLDSQLAAIREENQALAKQISKAEQLFFKEALDAVRRGSSASSSTTQSLAPVQSPHQIPAGKTGGQPAWQTNIQRRLRLADIISFTRQRPSFCTTTATQQPHNLATKQTSFSCLSQGACKEKGHQNCTAFVRYNMVVPSDLDQSISKDCLLEFKAFSAGTGQNPQEFVDYYSDVASFESLIRQADPFCAATVVEALRKKQTEQMPGSHLIQEPCMKHWDCFSFTPYDIELSQEGKEGAAAAIRQARQRKKK